MNLPTWFMGEEIPKHVPIEKVIASNLTCGTYLSYLNV